MAFFKANHNQDVLKEQGEGGKYISKSGIYPVTINFISVQVNEKNARSLVFNVDYEGSSNTLYGLTLDNNDGSKNFKQDLFNKLVLIAGLEVVADPISETHKVGKDQTEREFAVLQEFSGLEIQIRIQEEYALWQGALSEKKEIRGFYRADGATASEIEAGTGFGDKLAKDLEFAEAVTYKDNLTADKVKTLKAAKAADRAVPTGAPASVTKPAVNLFGN